MPIVKVYGLVRNGEFATFYIDGQPHSSGFLRGKLKEAVAGVDSLEIKPFQVTVFFLPDFLGLDEQRFDVIATEDGFENTASSTISSDVIIEISGLFVKERRTKEVKDLVAKKVVDMMKAYFPERLIECFVYSFHQMLDGFASTN